MSGNFINFLFMSRYTQYILHSKKMVTKFDDLKKYIKHTGSN